MSSAKNIFLMVAVFVAVILLWNFLDSVQNGSPDKQSYTEEIRPRAPPMTWNEPPASPARWFANGE